MEASEKYSGHDGERNWPGCEGREPLVIAGPSFVLHFHACAHRDEAWSADPSHYFGWKLTATGCCEERTAPPRRAALPSLALLRHVKARGLEALCACMALAPDGALGWLVGGGPGALTASLLSTALAPPALYSSATVADAPKPLVFESTHPYADAQDIFQLVKIPGAKRLKVRVNVV